MRNLLTTLMLCAGLAAATNALAQNAPAAPAATPRPPFLLSSTAFTDGGVLPDKYTQINTAPPISPPLAWVNAPATAKSFALIVHDEDVAPQRNPLDNLHWLAFNIPATVTSLPEGVATLAKLPDGTIQPNNQGSPGFPPAPGYMAPGAPAGKYHHYSFELFALDTNLPLDAAATRDQVVAAMQGHVVGKAVTTARFHR